MTRRILQESLLLKCTGTSLWKMRMFSIHQIDVIFFFWFDGTKIDSLTYWLQFYFDRCLSNLISNSATVAAKMFFLHLWYNQSAPHHVSLLTLHDWKVFILLQWPSLGSQSPVKPPDETQNSGYRCGLAHEADRVTKMTILDLASWGHRRWTSHDHTNISCQRRISIYIGLNMEKIENTVCRC